MLIIPKKSWRKQLLLILSICLLCMSGCGENVFNENDFSSTDLLTRLERAKTNADYDGIIRDARVQCQDAQDIFTPEEKNQACLIQAEAFNARHGLDLISTLIKIEELADSNSNEDDFFTSLSEVIDETPANELRANADIFNNQADTNSEINEEQQINRGLANTYVVVSVFELRFDFSGTTVTNNAVPKDMDGTNTTYTDAYNGNSITTNDQDTSPDVACTGTCPSYENLDFVIRELRLGTETSYASEATEAFDGTSLEEDQQSEFNQSPNYLELRDLRAAAAAANTVALEGADGNTETFDFTGLTLGSSTSESRLLQAIDHVLN